MHTEYQGALFYTDVEEGYAEAFIAFQYYLFTLFPCLLFSTNQFRNSILNMHVAHTYLALFCVTAKLVTVSLAERVVHERATTSTNEWVKLGNINPNGLLPVRIALAQQNLEHGHRLLMER